LRENRKGSQTKVDYIVVALAGFNADTEASRANSTRQFHPVVSQELIDEDELDQVII
jgi:hypothetical protein